MFANLKKSFKRVGAFALVFAGIVSFAVAASPKRIVSLSPAGTEILFAVGAGKQVVAVDEFSNFPPEAVELPKVGGFDGKTLSIEKILSFEPDFVYLTKGMHDFLIPELEKYKIDYYVSTGESVEDVLEEIEEIGEITGKKRNGKKVVSKIEKIINEAEKISDKNEDEVSVYYEVWNSPYMSIGGNTFISDVIEKAGGENIFEELLDWPSVSEEAILASDPDVILIPKSSGVTAESVAGRGGWADLSAVKNNKVFVVDDDIFSRPSPRIGEAIKELSGLLN